MKKTSSQSIHITQWSKSFADKTLFQNSSINFHPGEKIGIIGKNGCSKITLLRYIVALLNKNISPQNSKIGNNITKVKIKFLQMLSALIDVLILDEPTNHLNIPTRKTIETMLQEYLGALIFVSHDQYFARKIKNDILYTIQDCKLTRDIHLST